MNNPLELTNLLQSTTLSYKGVYMSEVSVTSIGVLEQKICSLKNILDIDQLKKVKNQLLKEVKEYIHLANQDKSPLVITLQQLSQQIYDVFKERSEELAKNKNIGINTTSSLLPSNESLGSLHPISRTIRKIHDIMINLQFEFVEASEVDYIDNIFDKLNMDILHPAREDHQSFYIQDNEKQTLRTHCTNFQGECVLPQWNEKNEIRKFHIGKTYRVDSDATHTPMFHQFEVFYLNDDANIPTLIGFMEKFFQLFFKKNIQIQLRTSYFPFTCPSYEVDIFLDGRWLEIGGCGIVHENVFMLNGKKAGKAWAWGMGIERITMIGEGYKDIRDFYKTDIRYF